MLFIILINTFSKKNWHLENRYRYLLAYCLEYSNTQYQITVNLKLSDSLFMDSAQQPASSQVYFLLFVTSWRIIMAVFSWAIGRIKPPSVTPLYTNLNLNKQKRYSLTNSWNSPGQNTGLLQGIFPTQGSNPCLPHFRWILYQLSQKGSPTILEWVAYPFSSRSSQPRDRTQVSHIAGGFFTSWATREAQQYRRG